jgi:hypothetical protein
MTNPDIRMYAFTYIVGDMKNTGMWWARSLPVAVEQIAKQWPVLDIMGISLVSKDGEDDVAARVKEHRAISGGS